MNDALKAGPELLIADACAARLSAQVLRPDDRATCLPFERASFEHLFPLLIVITIAMALIISPVILCI